MASTIKVNSISAQSGVDVNIPTGFKLKVADAGELYIGDTKITAGANASYFSFCEHHNRCWVRRCRPHRQKHVSSFSRCF